MTLEVIRRFVLSHFIFEIAYMGGLDFSKLEGILRVGYQMNYIDIDLVARPQSRIEKANTIHL